MEIKNIIKKVKIGMAAAKTIAQFSPDQQTKVGAVLMKKDSGAIIAQSYNGFVRSAPDLTLPKTRPEKYQYMIHSEMNLLLNCARHGISMENCFVVVTHTPCADCSRFLFQAGIDTVVAEKHYHLCDNIKLNDLHITAKPLKDTGYTILRYNP